MRGMFGNIKSAESAEADELKGFDSYDVRLGDVMRGERATRGKSLLDIEREIRIKAQCIAGIEDCDLSVFETPGFVAGYVRSYARYLDIDPEWAFDEFCKESGYQRVKSGKNAENLVNPSRATSESFLAPIEESIWERVEPGALGSLAVLVAVVAGLGYGGWSLLKEFQRVDVTETAVVAPQIVDPIDAARNAPPVAALDVATLYRPDILDAPILTPRDAPIATLDPAELGVLSGAPLTTAAVEEETTAAPQVIAEAVIEGVTVFATSPSWVRVSTAAGVEVHQQILEVGQMYKVPVGDTTHTLHAGNAGSVYLMVDNVPYGPVGSGPTVEKNVALEVDAVREQFAVADLEADQNLATTVALLAAAENFRATPSE